MIRSDKRISRTPTSYLLSSRRLTSGLSDPYTLNSCTSLKSALSLTPHTTVARYARDFGTKGYDDPDDFDTLSSELGPGRAGAVRGLSWFLRWGAYGGNTILSLASGPSLFSLAFTAYYLPLYGERVWG